MAVVKHDSATGLPVGYTVYYWVIDAQKVVPQHRERIFLVGFKPWRDFEFPDFPKDGPKLETILDPEVPSGTTSL